MQTDYWQSVQAFFDWVAHSAGIMVILVGLIAITWFGYERKRRGSFLKKKVDDSEYNITKFLRVLSYLGLVLGIFCIWSGAMGLILDIPPSFKYAEVTENGADHFTCIFLIVMGLVMFLKPVSDLPWASIIGLIVGTVTVVIISLIVPDSVVTLIGNYINPKWILVIIFIIVSLIVCLVAKMYIDILMLISKILSWPPIALVIIILSFIQGIGLWVFGISIVSNLL